MSIGYLCQWSFYAVFAVVSACCVPVSHADVLTRSAFRAVGAVLGIWGVINLLEGYGNDNPGANAHMP